MSDPHTWQGIVGWTVVYTAVAWTVIFVARLIFIAPFKLYYQQKTRADALDELRQVANDASRPPSFDLGYDYSPYDPVAHYLLDDYSVLRIWVENLEHRHIEDCRISIESFGPDPIIRKGSALFEDRRESDEKTTIFNLAPTEKRFFRFVDVHRDMYRIDSGTIPDDRTSLRVRCDQEGSGIGSHWNQPPLKGGKRYFVSMVVHGNDANSRRIDLIIDVINSSDV